MKKEARLLLEWYAKNGRDLPWRVKGGAHPDAYAVWVSEIMLQQTTVQTVYAYFERWMKRFPTLQSLAEASLDDVLKMWQGMGYYTRAKKMHQCAKEVMENYGGVFPNKREELLKLSGIGPYTASSLCAFAFNLPETVVDGNVIRVMARYDGIETEVDRDKIYPRACSLTPKEYGADYASAIMDLGATVCRPSSPLCDICPWRENCVARKKGLQDKIPLLKKLEKKKKQGAVFILKNKKGEIFIRKRQGKGLLSGLWEIPWAEEEVMPFESVWKKYSVQVRHVFTHFDLTLSFFECTESYPADFLKGGVFVSVAERENYAFSTLMKKVLKKLDEIPA
ncbi:MAG: A/G-specific adenine glycosylase [Alphaproteobacteria bacterium]|nr:A/G-specific adenine glycosylase [Alphaproteobacteria bacterium]